MINRDQQIRQFLEIARCHSLSKAADTLDMTQPGLSKQLASLETYIGQALFERHGRGVSLTDAGSKLQDAAKAAYELIDNTVVRLQETQGVTEGSLRIAAIHTLSYYFMADAMATFMSQRPKVNIALLGRSSPEVVELVESGKADVGFVYDTAVTSDDVKIEHLLDQRMCLIVHEESSLARETKIDMRQSRLPLIVFPPQYALRRMLHTERLDQNIAAEVETVDAMLRIASVTRGHCILPDGIPSRLLHEYNLTRIPVTHPNMVRKVVAISRRGKACTPLGALLLDIVRTTIRLDSK